MKSKTKDDIQAKVDKLILNGTPRAKALFICKDYMEGQYFKSRPILLCKEQVDGMLDSLTTKDSKVYNKWIHIFNTYLEVNPLLGIVFKEYQAQAEYLLGLLQRWNDLTEEETHLNTIYEELKKVGSDEALNAFDTALRHIRLNEASIERDEDGYINIDVSALYKNIRTEAADLHQRLLIAKAMVVALEEYTKENKSAAFLLDLTKSTIEDIKADYALNLSPMYSRKVLQERLDKGEKVPIEESKRAVVPYYEETDISEDYVEMFRKRIKNLEGQCAV